MRVIGLPLEPKVAPKAIDNSTQFAADFSVIGDERGMSAAAYGGNAVSSQFDPEPRPVGQAGARLRCAAIDSGESAQRSRRRVLRGSRVLECAWDAPPRMRPEKIVTASRRSQPSWAWLSTSLVACSLPEETSPYGSLMRCSGTSPALAIESGRGDPSREGRSDRPRGGPLQGVVETHGIARAGGESLSGSDHAVFGFSAITVGNSLRVSPGAGKAS